MVVLQIRGKAVAVLLVPQERLGAGSTRERARRGNDAPWWLHRSKGVEKNGKEPAKGMRLPQATEQRFVLEVRRNTVPRVGELEGGCLVGCGARRSVTSEVADG